MITSKENKQVKNIVALLQKSKERRIQNAFVAEGIRMVMETPMSLLQAVFLSESFEKDHRDENNSFFIECEKNGKPVEVLADSVFHAVADTKTPQGILAIVQKPEYSLEQLLDAAKTKERALFLLVEDIQDPGNLGTMMRTGEGAGVSGIVMSKNTVDLFNPKTIRSTMGSLYRVPFVVAGDFHGAVNRMKEEGVLICAAHLKGTQSYAAVEYGQSTGFLIGNEGNGLSTGVAELADLYVKIPMEGQLESLNAAVSAALLMYEWKRRCGI